MPVFLKEDFSASDNESDVEVVIQCDEVSNNIEEKICLDGKTISLFDKLFETTDNVVDVNYKNIISLGDNVKFKEIFNYNKLEFIIENEATIKKQIRPECFDEKANPFVLAKKYLNQSNKPINYLEHGLIDVKYRQTDFDEIGRYFAHNSLGLQGMVRELRNTIAGEYYYDADLGNAHPVIIQWLCKNMKINCSFLDTYIKNRDDVIDDLVKKNKNVSRDKVKQVILSVIYGGVKGYAEIKKTKWITSFKKEMTTITKCICNAFKNIYNLRSKVKDFNVEGSTLAFIASVVENQIIQIFLQYLKDKLEPKQYEATVLCFDGLMIRNSVKKDDLLIHISNVENMLMDMGISINIKLKDMPPLELDGYSSVQIFDHSDKYYYQDFTADLTKNIWTGEFGFNNLSKFVRANINRVVIRLCGDFYFMKKCETHLIDDMEKLTGHIIKYEILDKKGNLVINSISLFKLIKDHFYNYIFDYDNLICAPDGFKYSKRDFNTWFGFKARLRPITPDDVKKIQPILDNIKIVWANSNEDHYRYMISWLQQIFKYPSKKSKVALVLRSEKQQIGKGIIVENFLIPYVFGKNISLYGSGLGFLTERFNVELMGRVFIAVDEMQSIIGNTNSDFEKVKSLLTSPYVKLEIKNGKRWNDNNFMNLLMMTNNEFSIKIEEGDARHAIFDCFNGKKNDREYFEAIGNCFNEENADIFFSYIHGFENPVDDIRDIPETQLKKDMKLSCMPSSKKFIHIVKDLIDEFGGLDEKELDEIDLSNWKLSIVEAKDCVKGADFYTYYKKFCEEEGEKAVSNTKFGREISTVITKRKSNGFVIYDLTTISI
jgi:hypothetical protein